jgi:hypothetical protein
MFTKKKAAPRTLAEQLKDAQASYKTAKERANKARKKVSDIEKKIEIEEFRKWKKENNK